MISAPILLALRLALVVVLYTFIGWAFLTLWRDLRRQSQVLARSKFPIIQLTRRESGIPKSAQFSTPQVIIGREPSVELFLEEKTISARHARLYFKDTQWWVEDLGSTNGTLLNLEQVTEPVALASGDRLQCGQVIFTIAIDNPDDSRV